MQKRGTLYLLCGKMASGKSSLAKALAAENDAILLGEDRLLATLYPGEVHDVASYVRCSGRIKSAVEPHIRAILGQGISVVLDFPANTVRQREWMRALIDVSGVDHELHYLVVSDDVCLSRLEKRAAEQPEHRATDTREMFHAITAHFQPPAAGEGFHLVRHEAASAPDTSTAVSGSRVDK